MRDGKILAVSFQPSCQIAAFSKAQAQIMVTDSQITAYNLASGIGGCHLFKNANRLSDMIHSPFSQRPYFSIAERHLLLSNWIRGVSGCQRLANRQCFLVILKPFYRVFQMG